MSPYEYEESVSRHDSATQPDANWPPPKRTRSGPPRPPNAFVLWRSWYFRTVYPLIPVELRPKPLQTAVSRLWASRSKAEALRWSLEAQQAKERHAILYPNYKYRPTHKPSQDEGEEQQDKKAKRQKSKHQKSKRRKYPDVVNTPQNDATSFPTSFPDTNISCGPAHRLKSPSLYHRDDFGLTSTPQHPHAASQYQGDSYNAPETLYHGSSLNPLPEESTSQRIQIPTQTDFVPSGSPSFSSEQLTGRGFAIPGSFEPRPTRLSSTHNIYSDSNRSSSNIESYGSSTFKGYRAVYLSDGTYGYVPFVQREQRSESSCYVPQIMKEERRPEVRSSEGVYIPHAGGLSYNGYTSTTPSESCNLRPVQALMSPASDSRRDMYPAGAPMGTTDYDTSPFPKGVTIPSSSVPPAMNLSATRASEPPSVCGMDPMDPTSTWASEPPTAYGMDPINPTSTRAPRLPSVYDMGLTPTQASHLNSDPSCFTPQYELPPILSADVDQIQQNHLDEAWRPVDINAYQSQDFSRHATTEPSTYIKTPTPLDGSWSADITSFPEEDMYNLRRVSTSRLQAAESVDPPDQSNQTNHQLPLHASGSNIPQTEEIDVEDWIQRLQSFEIPPPDDSSKRYHPYKKKPKAKNARQR